MANTKLVTVKATGNDGRVVLWEQHEDHPGGEAFIANPHPNEEAKEVAVALTPAVNERMRNNLLIEVDGASEDEPSQRRAPRVTRGPAASTEAPGPEATASTDDGATASTDS